MDERTIKPRRLSDLVEESRFWDAWDLMRNLDEELDRLEQGLGHMIFGLDDRPVSVCLRPLPITPKFQVDETPVEFKLKVTLPGVPRENIQLRVDKRDVEVYACPDDPFCRPYHLDVESSGDLNPEDVEATYSGSEFSVRVGKVRKRRVPIR